MEDQHPQRMVQLGRALDEEVSKQPSPTRDMIEQEIADLRAEAPELGEDPNQTEQALRQMSYAFWRDWFAVDRLMTPLGLTPAEVWQLCLAREAMRKQSMLAPNA